MSDTSPTPEAIELGRAFLITLVNGVRTAVHTPEEQPLEQAAESVHAAADALFNATGGFSVKLTEGSAILNGAKIAFDGGTYGTILRQKLVAHGLTSIGMKRPPNVAAIRKLISIFVEDPAAVGVQAPNPPTGDVSPPAPLPRTPKVTSVPADESSDRRVFATDAFARLVLALRELRAVIEESRQNVTAAAPVLRHHLIRALCDLIDLTEDRPDAPLALALRMRAASVPEARVAGRAMLSISIGQALGLPPSELLDVGAAAALLEIGRADAIDGLDATGDDGGEARITGDDPARTARAATIARVLGHEAGSDTGRTIAFIVADCPHVLSSVVATAKAFFDQPADLPSRETLQALRAMGAEALDLRLVDALQAVLHPESILAAPPQAPPDPVEHQPEQGIDRTPSRETIHRTGRVRLPWMEKKKGQGEE